MATQRYKIRQRDGGLNCGKSYCNFARSCDDTRSGSDRGRDMDGGSGSGRGEEQGLLSSRRAGSEQAGGGMAAGGGVGFERCARHAPTATHFLSDLNRCSGPYQIKNRADFLCCRVSAPLPLPLPLLPPSPTPPARIRLPLPCSKHFSSVFFFSFFFFALCSRSRRSFLAALLCAFIRRVLFYINVVFFLLFF